MTKAKSNSVLENLPAEDQERLLSWIEAESFRKVMELVAAPPPEGLGIRTHINSLRRFYARHQRENHPELVAVAREFSEMDLDGPLLDKATDAALRQMMFTVASSGKPSARNLKALSRWILKLKELEQTQEHLALARERLALEREKFQYSAARAALNHYVELGDILRNSKTDNEDKIFAARDLLFGISRENRSPAPGESNGQHPEPSQVAASEPNR